ncbi:hypothetical protein ACIGXI_39620 [Kitasatospora aureofaciens]
MEPHRNGAERPRRRDSCHAVDAIAMCRTGMVRNDKVRKIQGIRGFALR